MTCKPEATSTDIEKNTEEREFLIEAEKYIQTDRKREIHFQDLEPNTTYEVTLKKHEFPFGTAVDFKFLLPPACLIEHYPEYKSEIEKLFKDVPQKLIDSYYHIVRSEFSGIVSENQCKWETMCLGGSNPDWFLTDTIMDFVREDPRRLANFRFHNVFWNRIKHIPEYARVKPAEEIQNEVFFHLERLLLRYPDIADWDLINEPLKSESKKESEDDSQRVLLEPERPETVDYYVSLIKKGHELLPNARFYINEYDLLTGHVDTDGVSKLDKFIDLMESIKASLQKEGIPINTVCIGEQAHFRSAESMVDIASRLDKLASVGLDIKITEFDVDNVCFENSESLRAEWLTKALTVFYGNPKVKGIYIWGFIANSRGLGADLYKIKGNNIIPNEVGESFLKKIYGDWGTNTIITTDSEGTASINGFPGDYETKHTR